MGLRRPCTPRHSRAWAQAVVAWGRGSSVGEKRRRAAGARKQQQQRRSECPALLPRQLQSPWGRPWDGSLHSCRYVLSVADYEKAHEEAGKVVAAALGKGLKPGPSGVAQELVRQASGGPRHRFDASDDTDGPLPLVAPADDGRCLQPAAGRQVGPAFWTQAHGRRAGAPGACVRRPSVPRPRDAARAGACGAVPSPGPPR